MNYPILRIGLGAAAAVLPFRILKPGTQPGTVQQAAAGTDALMYISGDRGADEGRTFDGIGAGIALLDIGGEIDAGDPVTSDSDGKGVAATDGDRVIGFATEDAADGDRIGVIIAPHTHVDND